MRSLGLHVVVEPAASLHDVERAVGIPTMAILTMAILTMAILAMARLTMAIRRASGGYT